MAHYEDLAPCDYFGVRDDRLLAVGWLEREHAFPQGPVSQAFFESLAELLTNPWQPAALGGRHPCAFCMFTGGPAAVRMRDTDVLMGVSNLFVPTEEVVFVAPSLVLHYIDAHEYAPPDAFRRAVAGCPPMRSMDYLRAIRRHGVDRLCSPPR
jgi:hypothetical protein